MTVTLSVHGSCVTKGCAQRRSCASATLAGFSRIAFLFNCSFSLTLYPFSFTVCTACPRRPRGVWSTSRGTIANARSLARHRCRECKEDKADTCSILRLPFVFFYFLFFKSHLVHNCGDRFRPNRRQQKKKGKCNKKELQHSRV